MHKYKSIFYFIDEFDKKELLKLNKDICLIYRNYTKKDIRKDIINLVDFCKKTRNKLFISNNLRLAMKYNLDGLYIPSFNKSLCYKNKAYRKNFELIGSAHNTREIKNKTQQGCTKIFLSPLFKHKNGNNKLDIVKFNLLINNCKNDFIALGGINEKNYKKVKLSKSKGFAAIEWIKKTGLN